MLDDAAVPAGLAALGDDDVGAVLGGDAAACCTVVTCCITRQAHVVYRGP